MIQICLIVIIVILISVSLSMDAVWKSQKISFSDNDYIILAELGARIQKLVLGGVTIIQGQQPYEALGSGNFLMYPWVSRLQKQQPPYKPVFKDGNGIPIHGMVVNLPMKITHQKKQHQVIITVKPIELIPPELPDFTQVLTLSANKLTTQLKVEGKSELPLCFGYHPYLQYNEEKLADLVVDTNLKNNLKLDEKTLLPVLPFVQNHLEIVSTGKYDHLFKHSGVGQAYFRLHKPHGKTVEIKSSDMHYWQVYTPSGGLKIAVEPMTFFGNVYTVYSEEKYGKLPTEGTYTFQVK